MTPSHLSSCSAIIGPAGWAPYGLARQSQRRPGKAAQTTLHSLPIGCRATFQVVALRPDEVAVIRETPSTIRILRVRAGKLRPPDLEIIAGGFRVLGQLSPLQSCPQSPLFPIGQAAPPSATVRRRRREPWARCRGYTRPPRARHLSSAWSRCILEGRAALLGGQGRGDLYPWRSVRSKMAEGRRRIVGNFPNVRIPRLKCYKLSFSAVDRIKYIYGSVGGVSQDLVCVLAHVFTCVKFGQNFIFHEVCW